MANARLLGFEPTREHLNQVEIIQVPREMERQLPCLKYMLAKVDAGGASIAVRQFYAMFGDYVGKCRTALSEDGELFSGPVEVDETYMGGRRANMSNAKRKALANTGRGPVDKTAVVGVKDRATKRVAARVVRSTDKPTLQGFVAEHAAPGATVYSDDAKAYEGMSFDHETVKHALSEYVRGDVHTNGIESLWSMLKRAHKGTFHKLSPKHLDRYVQEFAGRHNLRDEDTIEIMGALASGMEGKRLTYEMLIAPNGLQGRLYHCTLFNVYNIHIEEGHPERSEAACPVGDPETLGRER